MASRISRKVCTLGRPGALGTGRWGSIQDHSASDKSVWYALLMLGTLPSHLLKAPFRTVSLRTTVNKGKYGPGGYYAPKANKCTQNAALRKRKPRRSGAFLVNRRTSLVTQTAGHASVAEVAQEAVARARLVPVDVRLVMAKEVTGYGVVHGRRRSFVERVRRNYDPARDGGGTGGDVARDLVARNLRATGTEKRDADPREIFPPLCGSTRTRVVLDRVAYHHEVTYGSRRKTFEEHASAVVVDRVSGEEAAVGARVDQDAPRAARDVVANDCGTRTDPDLDASGVGFRVGFRAAYNMVLRHSGVDAPESDDPASDIAYGTVSYNSSVASAGNVDHVCRLVSLPLYLEAPDREARNAHISHALPFELVGFEVLVARTQIASGPKAFEQGESALAVVGAWITASSPRSFIPFLRITTSSR